MSEGASEGASECLVQCGGQGTALGPGPRSRAQEQDAETHLTSMCLKKLFHM